MTSGDERLFEDEPDGTAVLDRLPPGQAAAVAGLIERARQADGVSPLSEQGMLNLDRPRAGVRHLLRYDLRGEVAGYAQLVAPEPSEPAGAAPAPDDRDGHEDHDGPEGPSAELVVAPAHRRLGHGHRLLSTLLEVGGPRVAVWAHGDTPAARGLAATLGLRQVRELRRMRRPLPADRAAIDAELPRPTLPSGVQLRTFEPGPGPDGGTGDGPAWLALNAAAFAHHPEQGAWTADDLAARLAEPWFDPAGFFLAVRTAPDGSQRLVGFHWTKVHPAGADQGPDPVGEVYVVGVDPAEQGGGLGRALTMTGLRHLAGLGLPAVILYVDADNAPAVRVYERLGFAVDAVDTMYRRA
ncbi:mycothiol synthase [Allostreptomyces psammosilenae]|uniref:Mycothiol acetyltransferase n=1 Tax=Allostreptomyces psammosilenae TaxID=1892865 RepID=A0A853AAW9_9ACTN|nr:mycothiol synthase [Allostreptomyces psammosilenae]NYI07512.1 mycothiol synthase [Allostreptomyces psammosilenae]